MRSAARDPAWSDPPFSMKAAAAWSSLGWLILIGMAGGTAWWGLTLRRVLRGN